MKLAIKELEQKIVTDVKAAIERTKREIYEKNASRQREEGTQTEVDARMEKILRQREFNQALVKYRAVNMAQESLLPPIPPKDFDTANKTFMYYDELYRPVQSLINNVLRQK